MNTVDHPGPLPVELADALDRHGIGHTLPAIVEEIARREWLLSIGITYRDPIRFAGATAPRVLHHSTVWVGPNADPEIVAGSDGASMTEAIGWALAQVLGEPVPADEDDEGRIHRWVRRRDDDDMVREASPAPKRVRRLAPRKAEGG